MSDNGDEMGEENPYNSQVREQDRFLPIANISRIMKKSLPQNAKIAKEGKETVQECVSEFISFITSEASDRCQQEKRKTINGEDLLWAMGTLGFDNYIEPLRLYLNKYREVCSQTQTRHAKGDKASPSKRRKNAQGADNSNNNDEDDGDDQDIGHDMSQDHQQHYH